MLNVAVLGIGGISGAHIPAWQKIKEAKLVALCDVRPEMLEKYKNSDVNLYTDFEDMLNNEPIDVLDICLPTYIHADYSLKAIEKGINVLCEKPISLKQEDVKRIYGAAKKHNVKFMVAHILRFWNEYVFLKKIIDTNKYGKLLNGHLVRMGNTPLWSWDNWITDEKRSGLVPFDLHVHDLDWLIYALGKPKNVTANRVKSGKNDLISGTYFYDDFFITAKAAWYDNEYPFTYGYRFLFEDALVELKDGKIKIYRNDGEIITVGDSADKNGAACINLPTTDAYYEEIRYFTDCVINDKPANIIKPEELECAFDILEQYK